MLVRVFCLLSDRKFSLRRRAFAKKTLRDNLFLYSLETRVKMDKIIIIKSLVQPNKVARCQNSCHEVS